jgi:hypothetical protein
MAACTASGIILPSNLTKILFKQKWVFYAIYQPAFPQLYSTEVCSRSYDVIMDKDDAEYISFELLIETTEEFLKSIVVLFTFHGIWMRSRRIV